MKLNITVDLEWLGEDGDMDSLVKDEIVSGVKDAISRDCLAKVKEEASTQINKAIRDAIDSAKKSIQEKAIKFADDWLENEVTITDKWGDIQDCLTIKDLVKRNFDKTLEMKVNRSGKFTTDYDGIPLISYLMNNRIKEVVQEKIKPIQNDIDNAIARAVNEGIRKNVSEKFAQMVIQTAQDNYKQLADKS